MHLQISTKYESYFAPPLADFAIVARATTAEKLRRTQTQELFTIL